MNMTKYHYQWPESQSIRHGERMKTKTKNTTYNECNVGFGMIKNNRIL